MDNFEELKEKAKAFIEGIRYDVSKLVERVRVAVSEVHAKVNDIDKELDIVRKQNEDIRLDIKGISMPLWDGVSREEVKEIVRADGKETRKFVLIALFCIVGVLAIALIVLRFIYG